MFCLHQDQLTSPPAPVSRAFTFVCPAFAPTRRKTEWPSPLARRVPTATLLQTLRNNFELVHRCCPRFVKSRKGATDAPFAVAKTCEGGHGRVQRWTWGQAGKDSARRERDTHDRAGRSFVHPPATKPRSIVNEKMKSGVQNWGRRGSIRKSDFLSCREVVLNTKRGNL